MNRARITRYLKRDLSFVKAAFNAPEGEVMGTPGLLARTLWGDAKQVMQTMLFSMTPPIHVEYEYAAPYIEACISERVKDRLTKEALMGGEVIQLYVLSYRHESGIKTQRISRTRLQKAVDVVRSHATESGQLYYSIWIDSLLPGGYVNPLAEWADRGLAPYSFCYVAVSPGNGGIEDDLNRAWVRCEHQLAFASRGILLHPSDARPTWAFGRKERTGRSHVHLHGGFLESRFALRVLAIAISYGLLRGATVTYDEDVQMLKKWAKRMLFSKWPGYLGNLSNWDLEYKGDLPGPIAVKTLPAESGMNRLLSNLTHVDVWGTIKLHPDWDIIGPVRMIRHNGPPRCWSTGYELALALCGDMTLAPHEGFTEELVAKLGKRSSVFIVVCESVYRGLVLCQWSSGKPLYVLDVEITNQWDGTIAVTGYSMIHSAKIRRFRFAASFASLADGQGPVSVLNRGSREKFLQELTSLHYSKLSTKLSATNMYEADCSRWIVR